MKKKDKADKKLIKSKSLLRKNKATVTIKEYKPAEYVSTFFKDKEEDVEMALFFK